MLMLNYDLNRRIVVKLAKTYINISLKTSRNHDVNFTDSHDSY